MKSLFCVVFVLMVSLSIKAQFNVAGVVIDASNNTPQPFVNIVVLDTFKNAVTNTTTNDKGEFIIKIPTKNVYIFKTAQLGYVPNIRRLFITGDKNIGTILLKPTNSALNEIQVTAEKNMVQNGAEKKVINIDKNIASQGGTAADILQTLPGVSVDNDEKIQMRGSSNLQIMIDGKPTGARGSNVNAILDQIPASSIESIEIMNNPSAKYDPEGTGGIINIILKKNKKVGINGNIGLTVGTRNKYNTSGSLNYKNKIVNIYSGISFINNYSYNRGEFFSKNFPLDTTFYQYNKSKGTAKPLTVLPKLGFDFNLNKTSTLSISGSYTFNINLEKTSIFRQYSDMDSVLGV